MIENVNLEKTKKDRGLPSVVYQSKKPKNIPGHEWKKTGKTEWTLHKLAAAGPHKPFEGVGGLLTPEEHKRAETAKGSQASHQSAAMDERDDRKEEQARKAKGE